ncbi:MAG TPA: hypothetical protein VLN49_10195 [Gemmatimonadaceae bacterium]|nr:hypothetical protein [Gemmatimonadaceae bacterium]
MRTLLGLVSLALLAACSDSGTTVQASLKDRSPAASQLSFTVTDDPAEPGLMFTAGKVAGGLGTLTFTSTRYGSVCADDVTARDEIAAGKITLYVTYRLRAEAICPAVIRAVTAHAHITGLAAGDYEVNVVQTSPDGTGLITLTDHVKVT